MKLWMASLLPGKMRRTREKCLETPLRGDGAGSGTAQMGAAARTREFKEEFVSFVPGLAWEG